ncbi:MAG: alpha/beta hydrolase [Armatimonadota bacterium]
MAFIDFRYHSQVLEKRLSAWILIPDEPVEPVATLYLLHGLSDDHTIWLRHTALERYVAGLPLAVVMPDGGRGFYCDAKEGFPMATAIGVELVDRVDALFPTIRSASHRFTAGLSMGGYGALKLALTWPDRFSAALGMSGALGFGHHYPHKDGSPFGTEFVRVTGESPKGGPDDLYALAETCFAAGTLPRIAFHCGVDDFLLESNRDFRRHLVDRGIPHSYAEHAGAHTWDYWDRHLPDALRFLGFNPAA